MRFHRAAPVGVWVLTLAVLGAAAPASAEVRVEKTTWEGHDALRLSNGTVEVVVTTGIGPRVIWYAFAGGDNILAELPDTPPTKTALGEWRPWGGHRLWAAPEAMPGSYGPDNDPVQVEVDGSTVTLEQAPDAAGLQKTLIVTLAETGTGLTVGHRLANRSVWPLTIAPWALTIMNGGGSVIVPNEPYAAHEDALLPTRALATWAYTDLSDPRWTLGRKYIRLRTDASRAAPQKIGVANRRGWAAYLRNGTLFVKRYDWQEGAQYPDFGVNTETYTAANFIELETLGALGELAPGASATHEERWSLFRNVSAGATEASLEAALEPLVAQTR
jgi:hypothetical protein